MGEARA